MLPAMMLSVTIALLAKVSVTPVLSLGTAVVPALSTPILLFCTAFITLCIGPLPKLIRSMTTPVPLLPEMTLPSSALSPPTVFMSPISVTPLPKSPLGMALDPPLSVPIMFA